MLELEIHLLDGSKSSAEGQEAGHEKDSQKVKIDV